MYTLLLKFSMRTMFGEHFLQKMIGLLVEAIKEQQQTIEAQQSQIKALQTMEDRLSALEKLWDTTRKPVPNDKDAVRKP